MRWRGPSRSPWQDEIRGGVNVDRRAKVEATKRVAEILRQLIELQERAEKRQSAVTKRHAALMGEFERHARLEESALPNASEIKAAMAVMFAARRLVERFELELARIHGQQAKLLEELRQAWRVTDARERSRQVATFSFWLKKNERVKRNGQ